MSEGHSCRWRHSIQGGGADVDGLEPCWDLEGALSQSGRVDLSLRVVSKDLVMLHFPAVIFTRRRLYIRSPSVIAIMLFSRVPECLLRSDLIPRNSDTLPST